MAFLLGRPLLILAILGIHAAYGCQFVSPPNVQTINEVVPEGEELFTIEVDGDIERIVTNPASVHSMYMDDEINGRILTYKAKSAALAAFYDDRNRTATFFVINELVVYCVSDPDPAQVSVVRVNVRDENNKAPEFDRLGDSITIELPWGLAPINFASPIIVTDGDFDEGNTDVTFTTEPTGIISLTTERVPPSPGRLNYYSVFYTLDPNYDQSKAKDEVVIVKASDGNVNNDREFTINLAMTPTISPPTISEDPNYPNQIMSNVVGQVIQVAMVADNGAIDDLTVLVTPADKFDVVKDSTGQVSLSLREVFDPVELEDQNYIVRLKLEVSDATSQTASLPLAIRFERITVKAELDGPGYVRVTKSEPGQTLLKVSASPVDSVVYELVDPKGKIIINADGEISSEHSDDDIVELDGQVEVFEVTVKRLNVAEVKLKVAVVYKADPSLITTTTPTTETPVTCPTITAPPECTCPTETPVTCPTTTQPSECTCPTVTTETPVTCPTITTPADCSTCPPVTTETPVTCPTTTTPADCVCTTIATETATPCPPVTVCPTVSTDETPITCPTPPPCTTDPSHSSGSTCTPCDCTSTTAMVSTSPCEPCTTTIGNTAATDPSSTTCPPLTCPPCESSTASPVTGGPTAMTGSSDSTCPPPTCPPSDCSTASPVTGGPTTVTGSSDSTCPPSTCTPCDCSTASPVTGGPTAATGSSDSSCPPCDGSTASDITDGQTASTSCPVVTCPSIPETTSRPSPPEDCTTTGLVAGVAVASTIAVVSAGIAAFLAWKAWSGVNVFKDLITTSPKYPDPELGPKGTSGGSVRNAFENGTVRSNFNGSLKGSARNGVISNGFGSVKGTPDTGDLLSTPIGPEANDVTYQNDSTYDTTGEYSYANPDPDITTSEMTPDATTEVTKSNNNNNDNITQPELPPETDPPPEEPKPDYNRVTIADDPPTVIPDEPAEETLF